MKKEKCDGSGQILKNGEWVTCSSCGGDGCEQPEEKDEKKPKKDPDPSYQP
jgi:hypothetical protein